MPIAPHAARPVAPPTRPSVAARAPQPRLRRALLWGLLVVLLLVAQTLLLALTLNYEDSRAQDETDATAAEATTEIRQDLLALMQTLQALDFVAGTPDERERAAVDLMRGRREIKRIEWRDRAMAVVRAADTSYLPGLFSHMQRQDLAIEADIACSNARRTAAPSFSRSYFVPLASGQGVETMDLCVPLQRAGVTDGYLVGSFALAPLLERALAARGLRRHEFSFVEGDGARLARAGSPRGTGVYVTERVLDLPGATLQLRADAASGRPSLIPNLTTALVMGLSIALFAVCCCWRATCAAGPRPRARWPKRWPSARRWKTRCPPACARAT